MLTFARDMINVKLLLFSQKTSYLYITVSIKSGKVGRHFNRGMRGLACNHHDLSADAAAENAMDLWESFYESYLPNLLFDSPGSRCSDDNEELQTLRQIKDFVLTSVVLCRDGQL